MAKHRTEKNVMKTYLRYKYMKQSYCRFVLCL